MRHHSLAVLFAAVFCFALAAIAQPPNLHAPSIDGVPGPLEWQNLPTHWKIENGKDLSITAGKRSDWFISPIDGTQADMTPRLLFKPADDFLLSAKVSTEFRSHWDSGALVLYVGNTVWAKLCLEMTLENHPAIVSVVTKDRSDDSLSFAITGNTAYLKVVKNGAAIFFYASQDGETWSIVRSFSLGSDPDLRVGFSSQSPTGDSCTSVFTQIRYLPQKVNLWTGKG